MQQSRVRRGLATSAVAALAITGLTLVAAPADAAGGEGLELISQQGRVASVRPDGDTADLPTQYVDLVARRTDPALSIHFEVNADPDAGDGDPGWVTVGSEAAPPGPFVKRQWNGMIDGTSVAGTSVAVRAVGVGGAETTYSTVHDVAVHGAADPVHSVTVDANGGAYFAQPYADAGRTRTLMSVGGTTSATGGTVALSWWNPTAGAFHGTTDAAVSPFDIKVVPDMSAPRVPGGEFRDALDITGWDGTESGGTIAVRAERDSDEVALLSTYAQTVSSVQAHVEQIRSDGTATVEVGALDQHGRITPGVEIRRASDGSLVGYTDQTGYVAADQASGTSESYYANVSDVDAFEAGTDRVSDPIVPGAYEPWPAATEVVLADGAVFDDDEYAAGDLAIQVLDQEGAPYGGGADVRHALHRAGEEAPEPTTSRSDEHGRVVVPFDPAGPDGEYVLTSTPLANLAASADPGTTFVAGDATLSLSGPAAAAPGGRVTYAGRLAVGDRPLPGRRIELAFSRGRELVPGTGADAGILVGGSPTLTASTTTAADGTFSVTVADPAEAGAPAEAGGVLTATAPAARETATAAVAFGTGPGTATLRLAGSSQGGAADRLMISGPDAVAGERVKVLAKVGRRWKAVKTAVLGRTGDVTVKVKDRNGTKRTSYRVRLLPSARTASSTTRTVRVR
jgi:hypothetical protein